MDFVAVETIIRAVKGCGGEAVVEGDQLKIFPRDGTPRSYTIPATGFARRIILQIGIKMGVPAQHFWHPELIQDRPPTIPPPC